MIYLEQKILAYKARYEEFFYLDFEKPISDIMDKIEALKIASEDDPKLIPEIEKLKTKEKT